MFRRFMFMASVVGLVAGLNIQSANAERPVQTLPPAAQQAAIYDRFFADDQPQASEVLNLTLPEVPVIIDNAGPKQAPAALLAYRGRALHYVYTGEADQQDVLFVFTNKRALKQFLNTHRASQESTTSSIRPFHQRWDDRHSYFQSDNNYYGYQFRIEVGYAVPNLRSASMNGWNSWSDKISSVAATPVGCCTALFEHENYQGSSFWLNSGQDVPDLKPLGFNDMATSVAVFLQ